MKYKPSQKYFQIYFCAVTLPTTMHNKVANSYNNSLYSGVSAGGTAGRLKLDDVRASARSFLETTGMKIYET